MRFTRRRSSAAESLLGILVAVAIVGILAGMLAPGIANRLDDAQLGAERASLASLRRDFEGTFDSIDYAGQNESSVPQSGLPAGTVLTTFDQGTTIGARIYSPSITVDPAGWATKLAQKRGVSSYTVGAVYSALTQNQYAAIAFNAYRVQRCIVIGPPNEAGQQRYLLLSLMVPPGRVLVFPTADATQTFDSIWDQSWESTQAQPPPSWSSLLAPADFALWAAASANNRTNASRLLVERIVQPKYSLTVADNSPTDSVWVDIGPAVNAIATLPNSGATQSSSIAGFSTGILAGRLIVVRRGPSAAAAYEVQRFYLYSDVNLTIQ